jgi:hypothetical protein
MGLDRTRSRKRMQRLHNIFHKSGPTDRVQSVGNGLGFILHSKHYRCNEAQ